MGRRRGRVDSQGIQTSLVERAGWSSAGAMPQTSLKGFFVKAAAPADKENEQPQPPPPTNGATAAVAAKGAGGATLQLDGGLCEYEKQREARIQVNLSRLAELGLAGAGLQPTPPNVRYHPASLPRLPPPRQSLCDQSPPLVSVRP